MSNISGLKILKLYKKKIKVIFHFSEFSRKHRSFFDNKNCLNYNIYNSYGVINFAKDDNIKNYINDSISLN